MAASFGYLIREHSARCRSYMAILLFMFALPCISLAQSQQAAPLRAELNAAAVNGPTALIDALSNLLARDPSLAASPTSAEELARSAAEPAASFVGAHGPVYRAIAQKIIGAAPSGMRRSVQQAVTEALRPYATADIHIEPSLLPISPVGVTQPDREPVFTPGIKVGSFTVYSGIDAAGFFDDNIYATSHNHVGDWVSTISPGVAIQSDWKRNSFYAEAQANLTNYLAHPHENSIDWHVLSEGEIDITDQTRILLGAIALHGHEDRSSPDVVEGFEPTPYNQNSGYIGIVHRLGDFTLRVGGAVERLTFENVAGIHGEINNQDRDRIRYTFGGLIRYEANPGFRPFIEAMADIRRYDTVPDDFGFNRNSDGYVAGIGALYVLAPGLNGELFVGALHREYADPYFKALTVPEVDATLRWQPTERTTIVLFAERAIEETTLYESPGYIYSLVGARVEQRLTDRLTGVLRGAYAHSDFAQVGRNDNDVDTSVGLRYQLSSRLTLGVDYRYTQRVSGDTLVDFARNQVFFRIGLVF